MLGALLLCLPSCLPACLSSGVPSHLSACLPLFLNNRPSGPPATFY